MFKKLKHKTSKQILFIFLAHLIYLYQMCYWSFSFFFKMNFRSFSFFLSDICPILGPLVSLFWISGDVSSGFQSQSGFCLMCHIAEANVMYIPGDPPLVLHIANLLTVSIVGCWPGSYLAQGYYQQWLQPESNPGSLGSKPDALPTELLTLVFWSFSLKTGLSCKIGLSHEAIIQSITNNQSHDLAK